MRPRITIAAAVALVGGLLPVVVPAADRPAELAAQARDIAREFQSTLKKRLTGAMQTDGPAAAISVCNRAASEIEGRLGSRHGWSVNRTSLRVRNPKNRPGHWERDVLERFEARHERGEPIDELEHYEVVGSGDKRRFRYMKATPTAPLCLTCHGESLSPEVKARLEVLYPADRATGFEVGDIRSAFTFSRAPAPGSDD